MAEIFRLSSLTHRFGQRTVLDIEELTLAEGRFYTLTGANGSGKSTLLQILAFLLPPTGGQIFFRGEPVAWTAGGLRRWRREVTLLHQSPYLFDTTVQANVAFGLRIRGIRGSILRRKIEETLDLVGLADLQHRPAKELSGGESQRVAMARALAVDPAVLLLDEPLANVDRQSAVILERLILTLPARGTTVVMTTHDPAHPERLGSEAIRLTDGRLAGSRPHANPVDPTLEKIAWLRPLKRQ